LSSTPLDAPRFHPSVFAIQPKSGLNDRAFVLWSRSLSAAFERDSVISTLVELARFRAPSQVPCRSEFSLRVPGVRISAQLRSGPEKGGALAEAAPAPS